MCHGLQARNNNTNQIPLINYVIFLKQKTKTGKIYLIYFRLSV